MINSFHPEIMFWLEVAKAEYSYFKQKNHHSEQPPIVGLCGRCVGGGWWVIHLINSSIRSMPGCPAAKLPGCRSWIGWMKQLKPVYHLFPKQLVRLRFLYISSRTGECPIGSKSGSVADCRPPDFRPPDCRPPDSRSQVLVSALPDPNLVV